MRRNGRRGRVRGGDPYEASKPRDFWVDTTLGSLALCTVLCDGSVVLFPGSVYGVCKECVLSEVIAFETMQEWKYNAIWSMACEIG